jgi:hypothetical protein
MLSSHGYLFFNHKGKHNLGWVLKMGFFNYKRKHNLLGIKLVGRVAKKFRICLWPEEIGAENQLFPTIDNSDFYFL